MLMIGGALGPECVQKHAAFTLCMLRRVCVYMLGGGGGVYVGMSSAIAVST